MALTREDALALAARWLAGHEAPLELAIDHARTTERPFGWVFFVTTRQHLESGDVRDMIPGLGPVAVFHDRRVVPVSTSVDPARALDELERQWKASGR